MEFVDLQFWKILMHSFNFVMLTHISTQMWLSVQAKLMVHGTYLACMDGGKAVLCACYEMPSKDVQ